MDHLHTMTKDGPFQSHLGKRFLGHEACPKCQEQGKDRAGNNLGIYEDHAYCYSCAYYEGRYPGGRIVNPSAPVPQIKKNVNPILPDDAQKTIDVKALNWLDKYGIMRQDIIDNDIRWSDFRQWLIFPYRSSDGTLLAWQARCFGPNDAHKWFTVGHTGDILHLLGAPCEPVAKDPIVLVEDIVSSIRVAKQARAMHLFGVNLSVQKLTRLRYITRKVIFWLDSNKFKESIQHALRAELMGMETQVIYTPKDPKEYKDEEIKRLLA